MDVMNLARVPSGHKCLQSIIRVRTTTHIARICADFMCDHSSNEDLKLSRIINLNPEASVWISIDFCFIYASVPGLETYSLPLQGLFLFAQLVYNRHTFHVLVFCVVLCTAQVSFTKILPCLIQISRARLKSRSNPQWAVPLNTFNLILY